MLKSQKFLIALLLFCCTIPQTFAGRMPIKKQTDSAVELKNDVETATYIESNSENMRRAENGTLVRRGPSPTSQTKDTHPAGIFLLIVSLAAVFLFPVYMEKFMPNFTARFHVT